MGEFAFYTLELSLAFLFAAAGMSFLRGNGLPRIETSRESNQRKLDDLNL